MEPVPNHSFESFESFQQGTMTAVSEASTTTISTPTSSDTELSSSASSMNASSIMENSETEYLASHTSIRILEIIFEYALNKFSDTKERLEAGRPKFLAVIDAFVAAGTQVEMCLPAFPFKSANKVYKVLGILPDKAEEIALERLNIMCSRIGEIYTPGARCTIISDGLVYNDLLSISDRDTWAYGQAIRAMATQKGLGNIGFSRIRDLVDFPLPEEMKEITYVANATNFRRWILNSFGKDDIDIDHEIATNPDTKMTYLGYRRFLESDLKHIFPLGNGRSNKSYKKDVTYLAKQMLIRGYAFAGAVKHAFAHHLRLSIHQSTGEHKISMTLLNTRTGFTTPWHCSVALTLEGEWVSAPMGEFQKNPKMEIVYENGRPSYFQETNNVRLAEDLSAYETAGQCEQKGLDSPHLLTKSSKTALSSWNEAKVEKICAVAKAVSVNECGAENNRLVEALLRL